MRESRSSSLICTSVTRAKIGTFRRMSEASACSGSTRVRSRGECESERPWKRTHPETDRGEKGYLSLHSCRAGGVPWAASICLDIVLTASSIKVTGALSREGRTGCRGELFASSRKSQGLGIRYFSLSRWKVAVLGRWGIAGLEVIMPSAGTQLLRRWIGAELGLADLADLAVARIPYSSTVANRGEDVREGVMTSDSSGSRSMRCAAQRPETSETRSFIRNSTNSYIVRDPDIWSCIMYRTVPVPVPPPLHLVPLHNPRAVPGIY